MKSTRRIYIRDEEKNVKLKRERGVSFEDIVVAIAEGGLLDIVPHHNQSEYSHQNNFIILYKGYIYYVPFVMDGANYVLKTIIPSRQLTKDYLGS